MGVLQVVIFELSFCIKSFIPWITLTIANGLFVLQILVSDSGNGGFWLRCVFFKSGFTDFIHISGQLVTH